MNASDIIRLKRESIGLTQQEMAVLLGLKENGERTVRGWELGEHIPSKSKLELIKRLPDRAPFKDKRKKHKFTFVDLFAGIGGMRIPFQKLGGKCIFTSEWDKFAQKTYAANFGELPYGDITKIDVNDIPSHDILLAGFPCQAFSQAGLKKGFRDTRGTMFFEIQRILAKIRPKAFLLENVKQLKGHDQGNTLSRILDVLEGKNIRPIPKNISISKDTQSALQVNLNYEVYYKVLRAADFGVPQNRERIFIVGFDRDYFRKKIDNNFFQWPRPRRKETRVSDILENIDEINDKYTISKRLLAGHIRRKKEHRRRGNGFGFSLFNKDSSYTNTISARYYKDGSEILIDQSEYGKRPRKLTPRECARLQGFPEKFIVDAVSDVQIYRQFGNSVSIPVVEAITKKMLKSMNI
tara:strand:+ start:479 stop:1705 length:1227 start_codon:yes stop_codon:yes gene_type:complete